MGIFRDRLLLTKNRMTQKEFTEKINITAATLCRIISDNRIPGGEKGNWYNPKTGEKWNPDLKHGDPIGPHWDYTDANGNKYRVYPDGHKEKK